MEPRLKYGSRDTSKLFISRDFVAEYRETVSHNRLMFHYLFLKLEHFLFQSLGCDLAVTFFDLDSDGFASKVFRGS